MALQKTITATAFGQEIEIADCYIKVSRLGGSKTGLLVSTDYLNGDAFVKREIQQSTKHVLLIMITILGIKVSYETLAFLLK